MSFQFAALWSSSLASRCDIGRNPATSTRHPEDQGTRPPRHRVADPPGPVRTVRRPAAAASPRSHVEFRESVAVGDADQVAVEAVTPSVIRAGKATGLSTPSQSVMPAMRAGVEEGRSWPSSTTGDHHRHPGDVPGHDVPGFGHVPRPSDDLGRSPEEHLPLTLEAVGIGEDRSVTDVGDLPRSVVPAIVLAIIRRPRAIICRDAEAIWRCPHRCASPPTSDQPPWSATGVHPVVEGRDARLDGGHVTPAAAQVVTHRRAGRRRPTGGSNWSAL